MSIGLPKNLPRTRRTEGLRTGGRAERVVEAVLHATVELLSEVGYGALRVEDVASRSGVNKTTIYRRWSTKAELVGAALRRHAEEHSPEVPDTGSLRSDLHAAVRGVVELAHSPFGSGILRVLQAERADPAVDAIARELRELQRAARRPIFERAIARGELPQGSDVELLHDLVFSTVFARLTRYLEPVDETWVRMLVEVVVRGAAAGGAVPPSDR